MTRNELKIKNQSMNISKPPLTLWFIIDLEAPLGSLLECLSRKTLQALICTENDIRKENEEEMELND